MSTSRFRWESPGRYLGTVLTGLGVGWLTGLSVSPVVSTVLAGVMGVAAAAVSAMSGVETDKPAAAAGSEDNVNRVTAWKTNPWPIATLVLGIIIGSTLGLWIRTHELLGASQPAEVKRWAAATGLTEGEVARRLFDLEYPSYVRGAEPAWLPDDATGAAAKMLAAEVQMWRDLGVDKAEVANRLFDIKYPSRGGASQAQPSSATVSKLATPIPAFLYAASWEECSAWRQVGDAQLRTELRGSDTASRRRLAELVPNDAQLRSIVEEVLCQSDG